LYVSASIIFQYHGMVESRLEILTRRGRLGHEMMKTQKYISVMNKK